MTKRQATVIFALSTVSLVLALLLSRRIWFRLDLTERKAHTISAVSRNLYTEIPDQVRITYFVSDKLTAIHPMPGEITDLLTEYAASSHGKIRFNVRDPVKANMVSTVESWGIQPQQIQTVERDQASVSTVYTGIIIEYLDQAEALPVVFSLDTLEYDLTSRIRGLLRGSAREAGVIIGDAARQWERDYNYLNQSLTGAGFKVRVISPGEEIGEAVSTLLVLGGAEELDQPALAAINRYIQGGGKALFAVDAVAVDTENSLSARPVNDQGLLAMLASYGVAVKPELVLDQSALTLPFSVPGAGGTSQIRIIRYPHWMGVLQENANPAHPISAAFSGADLFWPSDLELDPPAGVEGTVLFTSTPEAWLMTKDFSIDPNASYLFTQEEEETRGTRIFAAALAGTFPSWEGSFPTKESRIVVIGDTDLVYSPNVEYTRSLRNMDFVIQAADWLSNDDDIIGIRGRQNQTGRLDRIVDEERRVKTMAFARLFNVVFLPVAVAAVGALMAFKRRRTLKNGGESDGV